MQRFEDISGKIETGHFLQSKEWEEFQKALGREVFRLGEALVTKFPLIAGRSYFYAGGIKFSVFNDQVLSLGDIARRETIDFQNSNFQTLAKRHDAVFFKIEPMTEDNKEAGGELLRAGFIKSHKEVQPHKTIVLDLTKSEEELLGAMHEKTRYNIRLAVKQGVRITNPKRQILNKSQAPNFKNEIDKFLELMQKTATRDRFSSHSQEYYRKLLELPFAKLYIAEHKNEVIAANVILFYGDTAYYLHGASDYEYRSLMAPYMLHWETIKYAKERGCKKYDLWGIDERKWPGVTRFKRGFSGQEIEHIGSFDYIFQAFWYKLYNLRNKLKSFR